MKEQNYHLYLSGSERRFVTQNLVWFRDKLSEEGRHTDAVDDLIIKFSRAKQKKIRIK